MVNLNQVRFAPILYRKIVPVTLKSPFLENYIYQNSAFLKPIKSWNEISNIKWISSSTINLNKFDLFWNDFRETFYIHSSSNVKVVDIKNDNITNSVVNDLDLKDFVIPDPPPEVPPPKVYGLYPPSADFKITWWLPTGWTYNLLMFFHCFEPWSVTLPMVTFLVRILMTPLVIKSQSNSTKMRNISPQLKEYTERLNLAKSTGNNFESSRYSMKIYKLYQENGINLKTMAIIPACQFMVFGSFFLTLRVLAKSSASSLNNEGFFWCDNLTASDPYYILNFVTAGTLFLILKIGVEFGNFGSYSQNSLSSWSHLVKRASIYVIPSVVFLLSNSFSSAICLYWASNNILSLAQVLILKNSKVRDYLKMPKINQNVKDYEKNELSFTQQFKNAWKSQKRSSGEPISRKSQEIRFDKAGLGPLKKTYDYDPTKVKTKQI